MKDIKNIVFDLGGVILNIDMKLTETALQRMGVDALSKHDKQTAMPLFFRDYEAGRIDDTIFISSIRSLTSKPVTDEEIVKAWNALLLDFPQERIELLKGLRNKYRLFLLSNTNAIHHKQFQQQLYQQTGHYLEELFEKTYYSHTIGLCKPDEAAFQFVLKENGLNPSETLFIDDTAMNLSGAEKAGMHVYHLSADNTILDMEW
jgi:putative hydrolase of the HAD superfamily